MRIVIFCLLLLNAVPTTAVAYDELIAVPADIMNAGQEVELFLYVYNPGEADIRYDPRVQMPCRIFDKSTSWDVVVRAEDSWHSGSINIVKNGFIRIRYVFVIPMEVKGPVRMEALHLNIPAVMFTVVTASSKPTQTVDEKEAQPPAGYDSLESLFSLYQPYLANIGAYKPIFFLVGADPSESMFQISLQYQLFNKDSTISEKYPWMSGIHLAYTQTSIWDLKSDSAPFEDTSYKPEVFFLSKNLAPRPHWLKGLFFQTGLQHESNGRGDELSRSTNFYYFRPIAIFYDETTHLGLQVAPKVGGYLKNNNLTNPGLEDYRGYFELELKAGKAESLVLGSNIRWAAEGTSVQLDATYPLDLLFYRNLDIYFHLQYVSILAETLLDYSKRTDALRIGFSIVR